MDRWIYVYIYIHVIYVYLYLCIIMYIYFFFLDIYMYIYFFDIYIYVYIFIFIYIYILVYLLIYLFIFSLFIYIYINTYHHYHCHDAISQAMRRPCGCCWRPGPWSLLRIALRWRPWAGPPSEVEPRSPRRETLVVDGDYMRKTTSNGGILGTLVIYDI